MPRPKNKAELLDLGQVNYQKLKSFIDSVDDDTQHKDFPLGTMNRNIRDVLMHLHHWHLMMMDWYQVGMSGEKPEIPAKGYTWKTPTVVGRMFIKWYYKNSPKFVARHESNQQLNNSIRVMLNVLVRLINRF